MAKTCWEHWSPETFLWYIQKQAGPGGFVHIDNEDMIGDGPCGQIDIDGNRFVDSMQRPKDFDLYYARLVNQTAAANALLPEGAMKHPLIMYTDDFISTGVNDSTVFADSIIHQKDGTQQTYQNCTVVDPPGPLRLQMNMFYADGYTSFSPMLIEYFELAFKMGATGIFHDEFPFSTVAYNYPQGNQRWDNRSVFLNTTTLAPRAIVSNLVLLTQSLEERLLDIVKRHNGLMIMNGAPQTRSWVQKVLSNGVAHAPINENENSAAWRALHSQLYTPMMLNRYGWNLFDEDPLYNHTDCCGDDRMKRLNFMSGNPCLSVMEHLDFGSLSMGYDGLWSNVSTPNIYATMVPLTAIKMGEGFVLGRERVVTKVSGKYEAPTIGVKKYTKSTIYTYDDCLLTKTVEADGTRVSVELEKGQAAVVVWG